MTTMDQEGHETTRNERENRAFLFDLDGVIVNSEQAWYDHAPDFQAELYGEDIFRKLGNSTIGVSLEVEFEMAKQVGFTMESDTFFERWERQAIEIYARANITAGLDRLVERLCILGFRIGLVSASRSTWISYALEKVSFRDQLDTIVSLPARPELRPKPHPDGYLAAMRHLGARPETTLVLEDSNAGIQAGKAAGALTIGFRENLVPGYPQDGADLYADTLGDVLRIVEHWSATR